VNVDFFPVARFDDFGFVRLAVAVFICGRVLAAFPSPCSEVLLPLKWPECPSLNSNEVGKTS
jgi:hypothetical protein